MHARVLLLGDNDDQMKVMEEEERMKEAARAQAAKHKAAAAAKREREAKLSEQKLELEARFEGLSRAKARILAEEQNYIDGFTCVRTSAGRSWRACKRACVPTSLHPAAMHCVCLLYTSPSPRDRG